MEIITVIYGILGVTFISGICCLILSLPFLNEILATIGIVFTVSSLGIGLIILIILLIWSHWDNL